MFRTFIGLNLQPCGTNCSETPTVLRGHLWNFTIRVWVKSVGWTVSLVQKSVGLWRSVKVVNVFKEAFEFFFGTWPTVLGDVVLQENLDGKVLERDLLKSLAQSKWDILTQKNDTSQKMIFRAYPRIPVNQKNPDLRVSFQCLRPTRCPRCHPWRMDGDSMGLLVSLWGNSANAMVPLIFIGYVLSYVM